MSRAARSQHLIATGVEICQTCYDEHYTRCDACGLLLRQDKAHWRTKDGYEHPYCDDCIRELASANGKN